MNGFLRLILIFILAFSVVRCNTAQTESDETAATDQEFDSFDKGSTESTDVAKGDMSLEDEVNQAEGAPPASQQAAAEPSAPATDEFAQFENENKAAQQAAPPAESLQAQQPPPPAVETPIEPPPPEVTPQVAPPPVVETAPPPETTPAPEAPAQQLANIKNIKYKANDNGGTIVVEADGPITYQTRVNSETNQFVIEVPNSRLPAKLKRPFNTKDMKGGIGAIDAYQNKGSTTSRIVVQLRPGVMEPTVQNEGNSLLIVQNGGSAPAPTVAANEAPAAPAPPEATQETAQVMKADPTAGGIDQVEQGQQMAESQAGLFSSASLEEFLAGNTQFYGKKISLEVSNLDIREVFRFISEESGINLVLTDDVKGNVSVKLRQVPWDQALVVIMKARKLGYTRAGNILRIAPIADLKAEEEDSVKMAANRKSRESLKVKVIPVSYAKIDDLEKQVKTFLSERGKVVGDVRTSSVVISDLDENIDRISKLIRTIDVPPPQVLIEGKVVEANDQFTRRVGVNWNAALQANDLGRNSKGQAIRSRGTLAVTPSLGTAAGLMNFNLGTLDILGDLNATLNLFEQQNAVKVLSSPRIVTIHNEPAEIVQTTEIPLLKETIANGITSKTVDFKPVKLRLGVTPQITNDASVILLVEVNRDFAGAVEEFTTSARAINTRSAKTRVMVRNAQTAVIGGIYQSDQTIAENRVPWVGEIPVFGWLFKNKETNNNKNELLIFLTPRILGQVDSQSIPNQMQKESF